MASPQAPESDVPEGYVVITVTDETGAPRRFLAPKDVVDAGAELQADGQWKAP